MQWFYDRGCELIKVCADPGDLILWDSSFVVHFLPFSLSLLTFCSSRQQHDPPEPPSFRHSRPHRNLRLHGPRRTRHGRGQESEGASLRFRFRHGSSSFFSSPSICTDFHRRI
jgi:hypothetical protein